MRCISRFEFLVLGITLISACAKHNSVTVVASSDYGSDACWIDRHGDLVAFLILAREDNIAVPYLVSIKCLVSGTYSSDGEAVIHHLNTIRILDSEGSLQRALPDVMLSDNIRTDQPVPSSNSKLYYFRAKVRRIQDPSKTIYVPGKTIKLTDAGMSFEQFLDLPREQRISLMNLPKGDI